MANRHDLELEMQGMQLLIVAMLLELNRPFYVTNEKMAEAMKWRMDAEEQNNQDKIFLVAK